MKNRQQKHQQRVQNRQQREHKEQQHFTEPVTGKRAQHIAGAEANQAYGDTQRQNAGMIRASKTQQANVGGWYDTFANEIAASRGEVAGAYDKANTAISGNMATAATDNTARNAALSAQDAQFAQLTGAPQNTSGPQTDSAAQGQRALYGAALAAPVAAQGANSYAYLTGQKNTAKGEGIYQKVQERKRRQSLQQDRKALLKEKGQYKVSKLDEIRAREQGRADEKWKVNKAFPLEKQAASENAADTAHDNAVADRNARTSEKNAESTAYNAHHEAATSKGPTPTQKREVRQDHKAASAAGWRVIKANGVPKSKQEWAGLEAIIAEEEGIDAAQAREAVQRIKGRLKTKEPVGVPANEANPAGH